MSSEHFDMDIIDPLSPTPPNCFNISIDKAWRVLFFIIPSCTVIPHLTTTFGLVPNANLTTDFFPELKVYECWAGYEWTINSYVWKKFKMKFFSFSLGLFCTRSITKIGESVCNKEQKIWRKTSKKENEMK